MSDFQRFAIYYLPDDPGLAEFGASWLGWDVATGLPVAQPEVPGIKSFTAAPRTYGFHGTLKPPFRLNEGMRVEMLAEAVAAFAQTNAPVVLEGLSMSRIGAFLALTPTGETSALGALAFAIVRDFDAYRKPAGATELERRRAAGLTPRQDDFLITWGYPYVGAEFRFHLTLTGKLDLQQQTAAHRALTERLPVLPRPFHISSIALVGERTDGMFQTIHRYALTG